MLTRIVLCLADLSRCGGGSVVVEASESGGGVCCRRDCRLLFPFQFFLLLVEGRALVWSAICRGGDSVAMLGTIARVVASEPTLAPNLGCVCGRERVRYSDGGLDDVAAGDAGFVSACALGVAGVFGGQGCDE